MKGPLSERMRIVVDELALKGVDQVTIAKTAGLSKGAVTQWLTGGIKSIKLPNALRLEKAYGYNHRWLVMGEMPIMAGDSAPTDYDPDPPPTGWPFRKISQQKIEALDRKSLLLLEALLMDAALDAGLDVLVPMTPKRVIDPGAAKKKKA